MLSLGIIRCFIYFSALKKLRGQEDVSEEIGEMTREAKENAAAMMGIENFGILRLFSSRDLRKPLVVAVVIQVIQQWSGINAVN